jgi:outer membrane beta-barrel protein
MKTIFRALIPLAVGAALLPALASAAEPEKVVVRNRLYSDAGQMEATASAGFTMVNYLTSHTNLTATFTYNLAEEWAVEVAGGYALSSQTNVAEAASTEVVQSNPQSQQRSVDDFQDLWQMTWNAVATARWSPIYGKLNVAAELPVHFKGFLLLGAGAGGFERDSLVYCIGTVSDSQRKQATCRPEMEGEPYALTPLHASAIKPVVVGGLGMRFYVNEWLGLRLEVRDVVFQDSYRVGITRLQAERDSAAVAGGDAAATQGEPAASPGVTNLVFFDVGATFAF